MLAQQQLQAQFAAAQEQLAASEKRVADLLVALNDARAQLMRGSGGARLRGSTTAAPVDEQVLAAAQPQQQQDERFCMRDACAAQRDALRHTTLALQESQSKLDRALEELAALKDSKASGGGGDGGEVSELKRALEEQFEVLDGMQQRAAAAETRSQELEAENELLLERLAELEIANESKDELAGGGGAE